MPSCKSIGRGAIIGAGAIVTADVAPYSIVVGNPARLLKMRFDEATINEIEKSEWWNMSTQDLKQFVRSNRDFVFDPMNKTIPVFDHGRPQGG